MREQFEKLEEIEVRLRENPDIRFEGGDYVYRGQALSKFNVNVAVAAGYVSGAWHAYQERWERFNKRRPELDSADHNSKPCSHGYDIACLICGFGTEDGVRVWRKQIEADNVTDIRNHISPNTKVTDR